MEIIYLIIGIIVGIVVGFIVGKSLLDKIVGKKGSKAEKILKEAQAESQRLLENAKLKAEQEEQEAKSKAKLQVEKAKMEAEAILREAKLKSKEIVQEATRKSEEKFRYTENKIAELRNKLQKEALEKDAKLKALRNEIDKQKLELKVREGELKKKEREIITAEHQIKKREEELAQIKQKLEELMQQRIADLEKIARMSQEEAIEELKKELEGKALSQAKDIFKRVKETATKEAKRILITAIQRLAADFTVENTVTVFHLPSDDLKGRIIGKEGRNIRTLEQLTGCEIIVDDTPEAIVISNYDPIRREVARLALKILVADGRIQPRRIEEAVENAEKLLDEEIKEVGERTIIELGVYGLHDELIKYVGRMKYRASYGQNLLKHSMEVARLCELLSAELGLSKEEIANAKRAGLLHDIGKVSKESAEHPHAIVGMKIAEKYGENEIVCNAIGAHHNEVEMKSIIAPIVQICDSISGARPGARREIYEQYIQRLKTMENIALSYQGVENAYAIQAGRELRVIVQSSQVKEDEIEPLAFKIAQRIQDEMQYPGQVMITVIRENRANAIAK